MDVQSVAVDLKAMQDISNEYKKVKLDNERLSVALVYEQTLRMTAEKRVNELETILESKKNRTKKTDEEKAAEFRAKLSKYKSNGIKKAEKVDAIRSYSDFKAIQDWFLSQNRIRDYMLWTVGVALGVRISDLVNLKLVNLMDDDLKFRERVLIYEKKTSKLNNLVITEAVKTSVTLYLKSILWKMQPDDYLFRSKKGGAVTEESGWRILKEAQRALNLPLNIGSHTMRKSFADIVACVDKTTIDMNAITKVQGLLNHSDPTCTLRYLGSFQKMYDKARISVSDFLMGKTDIDELTLGSQHSVDDVFQKLEDVMALMDTESKQ